MSVATETKPTAQPLKVDGVGDPVHVPPAKRVQIDDLVLKFQQKLGNNWDAYQVAVSLFLVGKLSRSELMDKLDAVLTDKTSVRFHNQLLLANLANCLRAEPSDGMSTAGFGSQGAASKKRKAGRSSQYEILKRDILSLPIRERKRLKSITRESGKKGMTNSTLALTRQAVLPKVPIRTPKGDAAQNKEALSATVAQAGKWAQDVANGLKAPLCSDSYELPEKDNLLTRMVGMAREQGLTGTVDPQAAQLLAVGLEYHLKTLIETVIARVCQKPSQVARATQSHKRRRITLTVEDLYDTLEFAPHLDNLSGSTYQISDVLLRNDDDESIVHLQNQAKHDKKDKAADGTPKKHSPISYLLPSASQQAAKTARPELSLSDASIGTPSELNSLLDSLLAE